MTKRNRIKGQTLIYKTLLRSIKIEQQVPHQKKTQKKTKLNSGRVSRSSSTSVNYSNWYCWNIFILYQSSRWALVLRPKTSKTLFGPVHFSCSFYLELYKNKFKNLNQTSKFKFSFRGLPVLCMCFKMRMVPEFHPLEIGMTVWHMIF